MQRGNLPGHDLGGLTANDRIYERLYSRLERIKLTPFSLRELLQRLQTLFPRDYC